MTKWLLTLLGAGALSASAADMVEQKTIGMELALDLASKAIGACRERGYSVSAVVVDRHGIPRAELRDDFASRFTLQIAREKANVSILSGMKSGGYSPGAESY